jgi:hypothetical protein
MFLRFTNPEAAVMLVMTLCVDPFYTEERVLCLKSKRSPCHDVVTYDNLEKRLYGCRKERMRHGRP